MFTDALIQAFTDVTTSDDSKSTFQAQARETFKREGPDEVARELGKAKTRFEREFVQEMHSNDREGARKKFQALIGDFNRWAKKEHGVRFVPVNRPRGDRAFVHSWEYKHETYVPKAKPEAAATSESGPTPMHSTSMSPGSSDVLAWVMSESPSSAAFQQILRKMLYRSSPKDIVSGMSERTKRKAAEEIIRHFEKEGTA